MAATQMFQNGGNEVSRQEIQAAIAKAVELRALHAALMQGSSPSNLRFPSASPVSHAASQFSAQDYPVFTPVSSTATPFSKYLIILFSFFVFEVLLFNFELS